MATLGCSGIRATTRFSPANLADLLKRGFAISLMTLACVALPIVFFAFFRSMRPPRSREMSDEISIRTVANGCRPKPSNTPRQPIRRSKPEVLLHRLLTIQITKHMTIKVPINPYPNIMVS